jgi:hypothetical protein
MQKIVRQPHVVTRAQSGHFTHFNFQLTANANSSNLPISLWLYTKTATGEATSPFSLFTVSQNTVPRNSIGSRNTVHTR